MDQIQRKHHETGVLEELTNQAPEISELMLDHQEFPVTLNMFQSPFYLNKLHFLDCLEATLDKTKKKRLSPLHILSTWLASR